MLSRKRQLSTVTTWRTQFFFTVKPGGTYSNRRTLKGNTEKQNSCRRHIRSLATWSSNLTPPSQQDSHQNTRQGVQSRKPYRNGIRNIALTVRFREHRNRLTECHPNDSMCSSGCSNARFWQIEPNIRLQKAKKNRLRRCVWPIKDNLVRIHFPKPIPLINKVAKANQHNWSPLYVCFLNCLLLLQLPLLFHRWRQKYVSNITLVSVDRTLVPLVLLLCTQTSLPALILGLHSITASYVFVSTTSDKAWSRTRLQGT